MSEEKPLRRMTLSQLLTHSEKCSRDLIEHLTASLLPRTSEFRDLTRPVRRRSHYPSLLAVQNALKRLRQMADEIQALSEYLDEHLQAIREHASRERVNRL
ncbi:MAG: hypothetical protein FJ271_07235 [Planctomycetes bacterium]|nr:hypothetical protein [Planctomycetota bacterium]